MIRNIIHIQTARMMVLFISLMALMVSCSDDAMLPFESSANVEDTQMDEVLLSLNGRDVVSGTIDGSGVTATTRAIGYNRQDSTIDDATKYAGIYVILNLDYNTIVAGSPSLSTYYIENYNVQAYNAGNIFKVNQKMYYPLGNYSSTAGKATVAAIAYAPYQSGGDGKWLTKGMPFSVKEDQTTTDSVLASDLIIGDTADFRKADTVFNVRMSHALTKVNLITKGNITPVASATKHSVEIYIDSICTSADIRLAAYSPDYTRVYDHDSVFTDTISALNDTVTSRVAIDTLRVLWDEASNIWLDTAYVYLSIDQHQPISAIDKKYSPKGKVLMYKNESSAQLPSDTITAIIIPTHAPQMQFVIRLYGATLDGYSDSSGKVTVVKNKAGGVLYRDYHLKPTFSTGSSKNLASGIYTFYFDKEVPSSEDDDNIKTTPDSADDGSTVLSKRGVWE